MSTYKAIVEAFERVTGRPLSDSPTPVHPMRQEADDRRAERAESDRWWAGYATDREMDGAAADAWYGRDGA